jgi:hypothetical protein
MRGGGRGRSQKEREREGAKTSEEEPEAIRAKMVGGGGGEEEERPDIRFILGARRRGSQKLFKYPAPQDPLAREFETGGAGGVRNDLG